MPPYQILHLLGTSEVDGTSFARVVDLLADALDPEMFRLHAWFLEGSGPLVQMLEKKGVKTRVIDWLASVHRPAATFRLWRAIGRNKFDLVHQHAGGRAVRYLCRYAGGAYVISHLHGRVLEENWEAPAPCRVNGADLVIATSRAVAMWSGADAEVVYPGVNIRPPGLTGRKAAGPVIGAAGRLVPIKGMEYLIRALPAIRAAVPGATLEVAGSGPEEDALKDEAGRLGLDGCVRFLGWQDEIPFHRWDVFAIPSLEEAFGIAALEAMAAGLPVVASRVGGLTELVEHGISGWLVKPADPDAIAAGIIPLLLDSEGREAMGEAAMKKAGEFTARRMTEHIERLYLRLLLT
jgi:glycosyltransferase involved in cell wall biosynthesis